jgi:hypothetical protein
MALEEAAGTFLQRQKQRAAVGGGPEPPLLFGRTSRRSSHRVSVSIPPIPSPIPLPDAPKKSRNSNCHKNTQREALDLIVEGWWRWRWRWWCAWTPARWVRQTPAGHHTQIFRCCPQTHHEHSIQGRHLHAALQVLRSYCHDRTEFAERTGAS